MQRSRSPEAGWARRPSGPARSSLARAGCLLLGAAALGVLASCTDTPDPRPRNLILISIDTLRPDYLGAYGYPRPTSPHLDALAAGGVLFEHAVSPAPWTLPAHVSLLTGLNPPRHGVTHEGAGLPVEVTTLAQLFASAGFETTGMVNSLLLGERFGLERGFATHRYAAEFPMRVRPSLIETWAREWLSTPPREPFFLFLHFYDVHSDYRSLPEYEQRFLGPYSGAVNGGTRQLFEFRLGSFPLNEVDVAHLADRYAAGIRQLDDGIGRLLDDLAGAGLADQTLVVVTSDHGEEFFEHGSILHGRTHYEEVLRVPLLLKGPGVPAGVRVPEVVSLVDVAPTLLALMDVTAPPGLDGRDLSPLWGRGTQAEPGSERAFFAGADNNPDPPDATASLRRGRFKLVVDRARGTQQLFDLSADPGEHRDVSSEHPARTAELRAELQALESTPPDGVPPRLQDLSDQEIEQLRALGYMQARKPEAP